MNPSVNRSSESPKSPANHPQESSSPATSPPNQPDNIVTSVEETTSPIDASAASGAETLPDEKRNQPISPPSEPMQFRAIGLVRGVYMPSVDQFTQGTLLAEDHTLIDAVLLGRVMSLVKNHLSLSEPHLWVVYPRTRKEDDKLHVQIVGVWEPETLNKTTPTDASDTSSTPIPDAGNEKAVDGYFSIRGEVVYQSREEEHVFIKIKQAPRKEADKPKFFKLKLKGSPAEKMVGHFWDLDVHREGDTLLIQGGNDIGLMPNRRKPKKPFNKGKRPPGQKRYPPQQAGEKTAAPAPPKRREPLPKPTKPNKPPK